MLAAGSATWALKELVHERRPDKSDNLSFPSGHTSVSFAAAMALKRRYGWQLGAPALAVASFVGIARVRANKHFVHDVIAGAALGSASSLLIVSKRSDPILVSPWIERRGGGVGISVAF
ncbi:phosphatase PAP2 family protein [Sphingomonas citri]